MRKICSFIICVSLLFTPILAEDTKTENQNTDYKAPNDSTAGKTPFHNIFSSTQWSLLLTEFEIRLKFGMCCKEGALIPNCSIGAQAHMIEPIGYFETTYEPLYFPAFGMSLGGNKVKGNSPYEGEGHETDRGVIYDVHFLYVPIMNLIFKKRLELFCFHAGDLAIPYMSEFDPSWKMDFYYSKLIPHMLMLFTPQALVSTVLDCLASESVNYISRYINGDFKKSSAISLPGAPTSVTTALKTNNYKTSKDKRTLIGEYTDKARTSLNTIRDTTYHTDGCNGFATVGGYVSGIDPILDQTLLWYTTMNFLHAGSMLSPATFLQKQVNAVVDGSAIPGKETARNSDDAAATDTKVAPYANGKFDTMCMAKDYGLPLPSQYLLQLAYPTVAAANELGSSGVLVSTAHNLPGARGVVSNVWVRRDYYAFAYFCGTDEENKK